MIISCKFRDQYYILLIKFDVNEGLPELSKFIKYFLSLSLTRLIVSGDMGDDLDKRQDNRNESLNIPLRT